MLVGILGREPIAGYRRVFPEDQLPLYGGEELEKGGLKLRMVYRDLPRGDIERPGNSQFPNPYNMGWYDFNAREAAALASVGPVNQRVWQKLLLEAIKDAVRGQMQGWRPEHVKNAQLQVSETKRDGDLIYLKLTGKAKMAKGTELSFAPDFLGFAIYSNSQKAFTDFKLLAYGQRHGRGGANGRATDLGPAPMAIAMRMYR